MVASILSHAALQSKDKNGVLVGSWASQNKPSIANCKFCGCPVMFKAGVKDLLKHSQTPKHIKNTPKEPFKVTQLRIDEALTGSSKQELAEAETLRKARELEIDLTRRFVRHRIPLSTIDCFVDCLKSRVGDSEIIKKMTLKREKARYISNRGIGPEYQEESIRLLQTCDAFSVALDESEINKETECEVLVKLSHKEGGIQLRHYKSIDLPATDAETIVSSLLGSFDADGIDYKSKMVTAMTDGCNVMQGKHGGVKKKLSDRVPQIKDFGSCTDHHVGNTMQKAVEAFDEDCITAAMNTYQDIGGAKGLGLKKKKEFEKVALDMGVQVKAFKKLVSTRFRGIRLSIAPILFNWEVIVAYYKSVKKPTDRQVKLQQFYVEREFDSKLKLMFVMAATREMEDGIDYFEQQATLLHENRGKLEDILRSQLAKFHDESVLKVLDEEGNVTKKRGSKLLDVKVDDEKTLLKKSRVFIGQQAGQLIKDMGLTPSSKQMNLFFEKVYKFHQVAATFMMKYFETGLKSTELDYMSGFGPKQRRKVETPHKLRYLANTFSKVVKNIRPGDGMDKLLVEIEEYNTDDEIGEIMDGKETFDQFWEKIGNINEGDNWQKYEVLPRFALALATPFNSGSDVERAFSVQSDIHRDPKKNYMSHETLDAHMQIRYGIESKENKENCKMCQKKEELRRKDDSEKTEKEKKMKPRCVCHCKHALISDGMRRSCAQAWRVDELEDDEAEGEQRNELLKEDVIKARENRLDKLKEQMKTRLTMYKPDKMNNIYETKEDKKKRDKAKKEETRKKALDKDASKLLHPSPVLKVPASKAATLKVPASKAPALKVPASKAPTPKVPSSKAPTPKVPASKVPTPRVPSSKVPSSGNSNLPDPEIIGSLPVKAGTSFSFSSFLAENASQKRKAGEGSGQNKRCK